MKLLIVEDEHEVADLIRRAVGEIGIEGRIAADAATADRLLENTTFDAVTLDLGIPDRFGLDWLESLAAARPELASRTLIITGRELERELVERVARCGAGALSKPFAVSHLHEAIRAQLARPIHGFDGSN